MYDIYDDNGALLRKFYPNQEELPDFIKESGLPNPKDFQKWGSEAFAVQVPLRDGVRDAYPIMNDAAAAISAFYFDHTHQNLPPELRKVAAENILRACNDFGVELDPDFEVVQAGSDYQAKDASATPLKKPFQSQGLEGTPWFPLELPEQVKLAAELFPVIIKKLAPGERVQFSQNLLTKCAENGVPTPAMIGFWAGTELSSAAAMEALEKRAQFMNEDQLQLLHRVAGQISVMAPEKVASILESLDSELGLESLYDSVLPDPQAIRQIPQAPTPMAKFANIELPMDQWSQACDAGLLDVFEPALQNELKQNPQTLDHYAGTPVMHHVVGGLEDLGLIEPEEKQAAAPAITRLFR